MSKKILCLSLILLSFNTYADFSFKITKKVIGLTPWGGIEPIIKHMRVCDINSREGLASRVVGHQVVFPEGQNKISREDLILLGTIAKDIVATSSDNYIQERDETGQFELPNDGYYVKEDLGTVTVGSETKNFWLMRRRISTFYHGQYYVELRDLLFKYCHMYY